MNLPLQPTTWKHFAILATIELVMVGLFSLLVPLRATIFLWLILSAALALTAYDIHRRTRKTP